MFGNRNRAANLSETEFLVTIIGSIWKRLRLIFQMTNIIHFYIWIFLENSMNVASSK